MTRYAAWRRGRLRLAGKILGWLLVACLVAAGALGGGIWLYLNESVAAISASSPELVAIEEAGILDAPVPGQPTTAIVIGYDKRAGDEADIGRSDTIMLLRANPDHDTLSLLSFPRDLVVDHPGCPERGYPPFRDRINVAYTLCGPSGTVETVKALTRLSINYVIVVNFRGFREIVNTVGGVYVDVDRRYFNDNSGFEQYATINLQPGYQKLTGDAALDYSRYRHTDSDFHRVARQQAFVKAFKQQVQENFSVFKLPGIINTIVDNVEVGRGGKKKLDLETILGYARFIYDLPSGSFYQARIDGITGGAELYVAPESIGAATREFVNPDVDAARKATQIASGEKIVDPTPKPIETSIVVLNGNGVDGAADDAAYLLAQRQYDARPGGNADPDGNGVPNFDYFQSRVIYDPAQAGAAAAARAVADLFGDAQVMEAGPNTEIDTMLRVIVGQTFHGTIGDPMVDRTPEYQPPAVVRDDGGEVRPLVQRARRKVDFPLLVPLVREESSSLDTEVPFRVYSTDGHDAVRIVYRTFANQYWGIQQLAWTDPPILSGASLQRKIAGRTYRLYYEGSKLHLVAFEQAGAVYWVSNTLLNDLSNETMLAIAKGLKPLSAVR
jgi:LCP family protein required for cell wall assembly